MEKKYSLNQILQAAANYATDDCDVDNLATDLKTIQSQKDGCTLEQVEKIDIETLMDAMKKQTMCVEQVVSCIINDYDAILDPHLDWNDCKYNVLNFVQDFF